VEAGFGLLVAGGQTSKLLESAEAAFDAIALFVKLLIVCALLSAAPSGRNHRRCLHVLDVSHDAVSVVSLVGDDRLGLTLSQQVDGLGAVIDLSAGDAEIDRFAEPIREQMNLGRQTSSGTPQSLVCAPFLRPVAAC